jgi:hypothetical protein
VFCINDINYNFRDTHVLGLLLIIFFELVMYYLTIGVYQNLFVNIPYCHENQRYYLTFWLAWSFYVILVPEILFFFLIDYICFQSVYRNYIQEPKIFDQFLEDIFYSTFDKKLDDPVSEDRISWIKIRNLFFILPFSIFFCLQ